MLKKQWVLALGMLCASGVYATKDLWIKNIRVEGLLYNESGVVFNNLPFKQGDHIPDSSLSEATRVLYQTGMFDDVKFQYHDDGKLVVTVKERPVLGKITHKGMKEFSESQLTNMFKSVDFYESRVFNPVLLEQVVAELKRQYQARGYYDTTIKTEIKRDESMPRVEVFFEIEEGKPAVISNIQFEGNQHISRGDLLKQMTSSETGMFSWYSKNDRYSKANLVSDLDKITSYYHDQGFIDVKLNQPKVDLEESTRKITITIPVEEGSRYRFGSWSYEGADLDHVTSLIDWKQGEFFSRQKITSQIEKINDYFSNQGYAKSSIEVQPRINQVDKIVDIVFKERTGEKVYVRRVMIEGNQRTRDEVIRRELRQMEGAVFSAEKVKRSQERLELLGLFDDVQIDTVDAPGRKDLLDIRVKVKERFTGSLSGSIGYEQGEGAVFAVKAAERNFLGSGNAFSLDFSLGKANRQQSITIENPYFTDDGVSLGLNAFNKNYDSRKLNAKVSKYTNHSMGASLNLGLPLTEYNRLGLSFGVERSKLGLFDDSPKKYKDFVKEFGSKNTTVLGGVSWSHDERDSALWPTKGYMLRTGMETALPLGDIQFNRANARATAYLPLSRYLVLMGNIEASAVKGYGKTKKVPFFQNYYLGGAGSLRGYDYDSIGPKDKDNESLGATRRALLNLELLFPLPGLEDNRSVRGALFLDAGSLWDGNSDARAYARASTGVALSWISPLGPMRFSYGIPIRKKKGDQLRRFDFTLGTLF